jgi:hypothetical protein
MAVAAFWLALAAVLIANRWRARHVEAERHATIRLLIEKEPHADLAKIKELLYPPPPAWAWPPQPKDDPVKLHGLMRMWGAILMIGSIGLGGLIMGMGLAKGASNVVPFGAGVTLFCLLVGAGLFFAARFVLRDVKPDDPARDACK